MRLKKGSVSSFLLAALEVSVDGMVRLEDFTYNSYKYSQNIPDLKKSALSEAIRRLRQSGLVNRRLEEGRVLIELTELGRDYIGNKNEVWDGKYRIVIWDIPEKNRKVRNLFRRRLEEWGFKKWQNSVWLSKRNVTDELRRLLNDMGLSGFVAIIESDDPSLVHVKLDDRSM